jgi:hypothetical protein
MMRYSFQLGEKNLRARYSPQFLIAVTPFFGDMIAYAGSGCPAPFQSLKEYSIPGERNRLPA